MAERGSGDNSGLIGLVLGALAGAGLTLLATPASGKKLRARLMNRAAPHEPASPEWAPAASDKTVAHQMLNIPASVTDAPADEGQKQKAEEATTGC
ncbi:MAG: YtxH domain-containing protein [Actinomycetota bacterium]|nr:YtxH domain-containing protein [Actinomycetota bacterium]